ncbi:hypothetical protein [Actinomarinicola tropica]|uniref:TIGR04086 family membrane protein n=1 Tax=Actinomarinicola tropica TaxID=2789776 RepID=A0A5Q2RJA8_9ACTN|nr:hypothetical protein [Actinomarinicola tropica]QGG95594.1 hypothetical protein GH723_11075 [Actinomarinicola tropica]
MALSGTARQLDRRALGRAIGVGLLLVGALAAASFVLAGDEDGAGGLRALVFVATVVAFGITGAVAGRGSPDVLPHTHGALASFATYVATQAALLVASAAAGRDVEASGFGIALSALLAALAGMIGSRIAVRRSGHAA